MSKSYYSLGLMSGTSMDGVDASIIQSDGETKCKVIIDKYFEYPAAIYKKLTILRDKVKSSKDLKKFIRSTHGSEVAKDSSQLLKLYDYSHKMFGQGKISTRISTRAVLDVIPLCAQFKLSDVLDYVVLSIFEQDSSSIVNDANILREYADSLGVYTEAVDNG